MNHTEILTSAVITLRQRAEQYGPEESCFDRISKIATLILNKDISTYDVAMIMVALKLGRLQENRTYMDNYVDGINYMSFAAQFASAKNSVLVAVDDDISAFAKKYAPVTTPETDSNVSE